MRRSVLSLALLAVALTACGGDGGDQLAGFEAGVAEDGSAIDYLGTEFAFEPEDAPVRAGDVGFTLGNGGSTRHTLLIEGHEDVMKLDARPGQTVSADIALEPGTYVVYCDVAGHRQAGMETSLVVE